MTTALASSTSPMPRPLPRSLSPLPGEALSGYLLNLAHRLDYRPTELAQRVGLIKPAGANIDTRFSIFLPAEVTARVAHACNLTPAEVSAMTLSRWDGLLYDASTLGKAATTLHGTGWFNPALTRACPSCLLERHSDSVDRVLWRASWKTPWSIVCNRHQTLLEATCANCGTAFGAAGKSTGGLIPNPRRPASHPALCRGPGSGTDGMCGHRIDQQPTHAAPPALLDLQAHLDAVLESAGTATTSLGVEVHPAQYLRDLRAVAVLLQLADHRGTAPQLPGEYSTALTQHLEERAERRAARQAQDRSDRTWTEPPIDTRTLATLLHQAANILALPTPAAAQAVLPDLVLAAQEREQLAWNRVRSAAQPSDGLFRFFAPKRAGTFSVHMLRAACPTDLTITTDLVPAYLDEARYAKWFSAFAPAEERNIRRAVPLAIVQLIEECLLNQAADHLGIPMISAQAALIRAGRACKRTGRDDEFRRLIGLTAQDLQRAGVNYGGRRQHLSAFPDIPDGDWHRLRDAISSVGSPGRTHRGAGAAWTYASGCGVRSRAGTRRSHR